ncbi:Aste57867_24941 [Aphanomyces stellatus]|uniref:Aste57867_24941 protein n=1 Tax=Aphanomyces stellatus TaxID=120398 RepID=A0A485LRT5_9STRA|nr:hypothetical protein As57867_024863 [Aphanomyces stellatus]VFU01572.1 Aste57867_24941 [Aphanomyces stellatus]
MLPASRALDGTGVDAAAEMNKRDDQNIRPESEHAHDTPDQRGDEEDGIDDVELARGETGAALVRDFDDFWDIASLDMLVPQPVHPSASYPTTMCFPDAAFVDLNSIDIDGEGERIEEAEATESMLSLEAQSILFDMAFPSFDICLDVLASAVKVHSLGLVEVHRQIRRHHCATTFQCAATQIGIENSPDQQRVQCPWTIEIKQNHATGQWGIHFPEGPTSASTHHNHPLHVPQLLVQPPPRSYRGLPMDAWFCDPYAEFMAARDCLVRDLGPPAAGPPPFHPFQMPPSSWLELLQDHSRGEVCRQHLQSLLLHPSPHNASLDTPLAFALGVYPIQDICPMGPFPSLLAAETAFHHWNRTRGYAVTRRNARRSSPAIVFECIDAAAHRCPWHVVLHPTTSALFRDKSAYAIARVHWTHNHNACWDAKRPSKRKRPPHDTQSIVFT